MMYTFLVSWMHSQEAATCYKYEVWIVYLVKCKAISCRRYQARYLEMATPRMLPVVGTFPSSPSFPVFFSCFGFGVPDFWKGSEYIQPWCCLLDTAYGTIILLNTLIVYKFSAVLCNFLFCCINCESDNLRTWNMTHFKLLHHHTMLMK